MFEKWIWAAAVIVFGATTSWAQAPTGLESQYHPSWPSLPQQALPAPTNTPVQLPAINPTRPPAAADTPAATQEPLSIAQLLEGKVNDSALLAWNRFNAVWNYPITKVEGHAITPGSIICCLVLMWIGYIAARLMAWWFGSRFLPRLGVHPSAIVPLQTICHYVLVATFTMLSLRIANVPLTAFTFLGGAIAIGVGFGSQTVMNNFISGLILLAERPIRVGDAIEIDGHSGRVTKIGPRSTHIQTGTNIVIVVPNSKFLEGTVKNWTLTDDMVGTKITCGVAYGSRTRDVERWLLEAARRQDEILQEPAPSVVFADFGDNALQFELNFWISLREGHSRTQVESDLRFEIDDLFRSAGIVMAYPQRDIHLNVMRPVEVRMLGSGENSSRAA